VVGGNHVNVQGVGAGVFDNLTASNGDQDVIGSLAPTSQGGTMNAIQGSVAFGFESNTVTAPVTLTLDDSGDSTTTPRRVTLQTLALTPSINRTGIYNLGGNGEHVYWNLPSGSSVTVHGRAGGNETFAVQGLLNNIPEPTIMAGGSNNTLQGPDTVNTWQITGPNAGTLDGLLSFNSVQTLIGGAAADTFAFHTGGSLTGSINGGGGTNTLDYTAYQGNITVDLALNMASLVGQGVFNVENVNGSRGNDLIVGNANANVLVGGTGRNIIIGGGGADSLTGGGGDNIVIAGTTAYDQDPTLTALDAIFAEWTSSDSLATRMKDIRSGGGQNGNYYLSGKATKLGGPTVFDNPTRVQLYDGAGFSWFFADPPDDTFDNGGNPKAGDVLTVVR
jgi:hypothetical protein